MPNRENELLHKAMKYCENIQVDSFEYESESLKIVIKKTGSFTEANRENTSKSEKPTNEMMEQVVNIETDYTETKNSECKKLLSEMAGIFYDRPSPESEPFLSIGCDVVVGDVIGLVEVMKCFMEVKATASGKVREILTLGGMMVEYGQPLAVIEEAIA